MVSVLGHGAEAEAILRQYCKLFQKLNSEHGRKIRTSPDVGNSYLKGKIDLTFLKELNVNKFMNYGT